MFNTPNSLKRLLEINNTLKSSIRGLPSLGHRNDNMIYMKL